jgi:hypothetical protein
VVQDADWRMDGAEPEMRSVTRGKKLLRNITPHNKRNSEASSVIRACQCKRFNGVTAIITESEVPDNITAPPFKGGVVTVLRGKEKKAGWATTAPLLLAPYLIQGLVR